MSAERWQCTIGSNCIKCGACVEAAPGFFRREANLIISRPIAKQIVPGDVREAQAACPVGAVGLLQVKRHARA